ncbi:MAG TPA: oligoendopeptidase F, partial [Clostridiales bacterium UBA8960]|nr:oligoendopeptidase F [Clostridiales bacterium UBA8960]
MKREEIAPQYKWDLTDLFENDEAWENVFVEVKTLADQFRLLKGSLTSSSEKLLESLKLQEDLSRKLMNVVVYAKMKQDENTKASTYQGLVARAEGLMSEVGEITAFAVPEILQLEYSAFTQLLNHPELKVYSKYFENLFRGKAHILSEEVEAVLAQSEELGVVPSNAFGMLTNADMVFEDAIDSEGKAHKLTNGSYVSLMMSKDRVLREDAFNKLYKVYGAHLNTLSTLLQSEVKKNIFYSKVRKHKSAREAALF